MREFSWLPVPGLGQGCEFTIKLPGLARPADSEMRTT